MSRLGELLRTSLARFDGSGTPEKTREVLFREAARWVETLGVEVADSRERADFLLWASRSPEHLDAFLVMVDIIPALREMGPDRLRQAAKEAELGEKTSVSKWDGLKSHPLVILTNTVIVAVGLTWAAAYELAVKPQNRQIEQQTQQIAQLEAQLASARKSAAPSPDSAEASDRNKPTSTRGKPVERERVQQQGPDQQHSLPSVK